MRKNDEFCMTHSDINFSLARCGCEMKISIIKDVAFSGVNLHIVRFLKADILMLGPSN
jgi:hypothetical protein